LEFKKGGSYVVRSDFHVGSVLGEVFSGQASQITGRPWVIKLNNDRILYKKWSLSNKKTFYIRNSFDFDTSIFNLLGDKYDFDVLRIYSVFDFIFENRDHIGKNIDSQKINDLEKIILQIAMCLVAKTELVIVDSLVHDLHHDMFEEALISFRDYSKDSIIVNLTNKNDSNYSYKI
jgi:hypothetical protein